jgi:hypothetical protein
MLEFLSTGKIIAGADDVVKSMIAAISKRRQEDHNVEPNGNEDKSMK